jgi:hypothetical protein
MIPILKPLAVLIGLVLAGTASANCIGKVTIGEGGSAISTSVTNKTVGEACLND